MKRFKRWIRKALGSGQLKWALGGLCLTSFMLLFASVAQAAGGGHHGELHVNWWKWDTDAPPVGWFILDFIAFIVLLVYFAGKPIRAAFEARHVRIKNAVVEAKETFDAANDRYEDYKGKLANVDDEAASFVERGREDGKAEREKIVDAGSQYADRVRKDSETIVEQEFSAANLRLQRDTARAVLKRTEEILRRGLTDDDRKRLVDEAIAHLEAEDEAPAPSKRRKAKSTQPRAGGAA